MKNYNLFFKKLLSILVLSIILVTFVFSASILVSAESDPQTTVATHDYSFISPKEATDLAYAFLKRLDSSELEFVSNTPVYNIDETFFGYELNFRRGDKVENIIIRDTNRSNLVIHKFSLGKDLNQFNTNALTQNNQNKTKSYLIGAFETAKSIGNNLLQRENREIISKFLVKFNIRSLSLKANMPEVDRGLINKDYKKLTKFTNNSYYEKEKHILPGASVISFGQQHLLYISDDGNCGPTAAFNVVKYFDNRGYGTMTDKSDDDVYSAIVDYMGKEESTTIYEMVGGIEKYVKNNTSYKISYTHYVPPLWSYFKSDLKNGHPILYTIAGENFVAHAMAAMGYLELKESKSWMPKTFHFLIVASGWSSVLEYTNFDAVSLKLGCVVKIKS